MRRTGNREVSAPAPRKALDWIVFGCLLLLALGVAASVFAWFAPGRPLVDPGPWSWIAGSLVAVSFLTLGILLRRNGVRAVVGVLQRESSRAGTDRPPAVENYPAWVLLLALSMGLGVLAWGGLFLARAWGDMATYHAFEMMAAGLVLAGAAGLGLYRRLRQMENRRRRDER